VSDAPEDQHSRRIVVGVDDGAAASAGLRWAVAEAGRRSADLHVIRGLSSAPASAAAGGAAAGGAADLGAAGEELEALLDKEARPELSPERVSAAVVTADVGAELVAAANTAQLLVLGSTVRHETVAALVGSVARHCTEHATCPVVLVRPDTSLSGDGRIIVGLDSSLGGAEALKWALAEGARTGSAVTAVYSYSAGSGSAAIDARRAAEDELEMSVRSVVGHRELPVHLDAQAVAGDPGETLAAHAEGADLLVVGHRRRGAVARALLGSVSRHCARSASCPVVVVPTPAARLLERLVPREQLAEPH
jgi:nucleotide-binding universal stress UspA family protein